MRLWHYTNKESFDAILGSKLKPGQPMVALLRADGYGNAILNLSLQKFKDGKPSGVDTHFGDGIYVTDIVPGSMRMADICGKLWGPRGSRSKAYLDRVKYHFQFEVGDLYIPCREHVFKLDLAHVRSEDDIRIVKHGRTKELTDHGSEHI